jgi:hypothetical protein
MPVVSAKGVSRLSSERFVPDWGAIFSRWPLYSEIGDWKEVEIDLEAWVAWAMWVGTTFDLHCPKCGKHSVFSRPSADGLAAQVQRLDHKFRLAPWATLNLDIDFHCARNADHVARIFFQIAFGKWVMKIGQYPSIADLAEDDLTAYRKVLGDERSKELQKAVGLIAHGVGAGSLIYLRRTVEFLVSEASARYKADLGTEPFDIREKMEEKIKLLSGYLPEFIVTHRRMYGILSDGLHNRSEEDCKALFAPCLEGIKLGLDDLEAARAKKIRIAAASSELDSVAAQVKRMESDMDMKGTQTIGKDKDL